MATRTALVALALVGATASTTLAAQGYLAQPSIHGNTLVFASEGDLWVATLPADPAAKVVAYRLTNGPGIESNPILSPDGASVAYSAEYEGNRDVFVVPLRGGTPNRLTYHPAPDAPIAWSPDGTRLAIRSPRLSPLGRAELFYVSVSGGLAEPAGFGECSQIAFPSAGTGGGGSTDRFAFCRWSNENWNWKRYRGGTAPDVWFGDLGTKSFTNLSRNVANDLFPMFVGSGGDRLYFLSDRDGAQNIWSMAIDGSGLKQHTHFTNDPSKPTDLASYELRWPQSDRGGKPVIAFAQGGTIALLDVSNDTVRRLDVDLVSDRVGTLPRFVSAQKNASAISLSPKGDRLLVETRGELVTLPIGKPRKGVQVGPRQVTHDSKSREWGAVWLNDKDLACITDAGGEQQIALLPADGSATPRLATTDRSQWLLRPAASPEGTFIAFGDKDLRLWLMDVSTRTLTEIDRSEAGEITDYSFSPDGTWLAWSKVLPNGFSWIRLRSTRDGTTIDLSDGRTSDKEPRWDPKGEYLWFLSDRAVNPVVTGPDLQFVIPEMSQICVVPLAATTPPPSLALAAAADFDLKGWAEPASDEDEKDDAEGDEKAGKDAPKESPAKESKNAKDAKPAHEPGENDEEPMKLDTAGIRDRIWRMDVEPGNYSDLVATFGGVYFLSSPTRGIADAEWPEPPLGEAIATLKHFSVLEGETKDIVEGISTYAANKGGTVLAWLKDGKFVSHDGGDKSEPLEASDMQVQIDPPAEWRQMLDETWRLQRDFYWAPNMAGVDWKAMRERYGHLLELVGTRSEAADVMGQLISELGTSHTYIMGGDEPDRPRPIANGTLGATFVREGNTVRIASIMPSMPGDPDLVSPLALPHLEIKPGMAVFSIDGRTVRPERDLYELLQDRGGKTVVLELADDAQGNNRRTVEVTALGDDHALLYAQWVENNRRYVEEHSGGKLGYVHIPDMDADGLIMFSKLFYPQTKKDGMVVDIRDNGGGWVSQMILACVARKPWAYQIPRQGGWETYPARVVDGPKVVLIDQNAGSDGDIFPESIRINKIAPLIGTRTWGGVVGIRGDKPYVDLGVSTQPEFAWFDPLRGWSVENTGVAPDIEIDITPLDRLEKKDPQLDKGIEVLMKDLSEHPRQRPTLPPFPDRSRAK